MPTINDGAGQRGFLTFRLGGEEYGVEILRVREIVQFDTVTVVPTAPRFIRGVINLRGNVVPVVDLAVKLGLAPTEVTKWSCIVVVEVESAGEELVVGLLADAVSQVADLSEADIEPPPSFGTRLRPEYLIGMGKAEKKFILLLDVDRILSEAELRTVAGLEEGAGQPAGRAGAGDAGTPASEAGQGAAASGRGADTAEA